jgi:hypothetical protein
MNQARVLVFEVGSTTPFLSEEYQDLRFVITDRVVNGSPVWATVVSERFMYRTKKKMMMIGGDSDCAAGRHWGYLYSNK